MREECEERAERYGREWEGKFKEAGKVDVGLLMARMASQMVGYLCGEEKGDGPVVGRTLDEMCEVVERVRVEEELRRVWGGGG